MRFRRLLVVVVVVLLLLLLYQLLDWCVGVSKACRPVDHWRR